MYARNKMIDEMIVQIRGVFQHYTDNKMSESDADTIRNALEQTIPTAYTSNQWEDYAAAYDARVDQAD
jgi:hypothetical protein